MRKVTFKKEGIANKLLVTVSIRTVILYFSLMTCCILSTGHSDLLHFGYRSY